MCARLALLLDDMLWLKMDSLLFLWSRNDEFLSIS